MTNEFILQVIEKFNTSNIADLSLTQGDTSISLKKKECCNYIEETNQKSSSTATVPSPTAVPSPSQAQSLTARPEAAAYETVNSPIVGTFYRSPSPDSPAYAEKGRKIKKGEPICIIEAMKMMNTLNADYDLEIVDVLVQNGDLIEYDQPLFSIKKM